MNGDHSDDEFISPCEVGDDYISTLEGDETRERVWKCMRSAPEPLSSLEQTAAHNSFRAESYHGKGQRD